MSTITVGLDRGLAQTVRITTRWKMRRHSTWLTRKVFEGIDFAARGLFHVWRNRRYLSATKLANMALVNVQFKLKTQYVVGRPYSMKIESTNICNTKCQLCPTGLGLEGRAKGKMTFEQYAKLISQLKRHLVALDLSMWGDPLIVPDIYKMIRHAHDNGIWTYISSNLHAFKPGRGQAKQLVESGLDLMTCSLHGASQETFAIYQPGKDFGDAVEKVRHIIDTRNKMGSRTPEVQLNFVVTKHNEHEQEQFKALAQELGCKAVFSTPALNLRFLDQDKKLQPLGLAPDILEKKTKQHIADWLPSDETHVLEPYKRILEGEAFRGEDYNGKKMYDCSWPWQKSVINWDGTVVTCCGSFDPSEDLGNVFEQPFGKIWNSKRYRMARRSFQKKVTGADAQGNGCATCPGFML